MKGIADEQEKSSGLWSKIKTGALGVLTGTALYDGIKEIGTKIFEFGKESVNAFNEAQQSAGHLNANLLPKPRLMRKVKRQQIKSGSKKKMMPRTYA